jgi:uncharacterized protein
VTLVRPWILLLALVAAFSAAFTVVGLPTPTLFGGLAGALVYAIARPRRPLALPASGFTFGQAVVGIVIGLSVDWEALWSLGWTWLLVVVVSCFSLVVSVLVGQLLMRHGVSRVTATFSSIAGGAAGLTAIADELGADARVVSTLQYLRLLAVLVTMPLVATVVYGVHTAGTDAGTTYLDLEHLPLDLAFTAVALGLGLWLGRVLHFPTHAILGPLFVSALMSLVPWFDGVEVPWIVVTLGYVCIGVQVGLKFTLASLQQIGRMIPTAMVTIVVTILACFGLSWVLVALTSESPLDAYLATNPGGVYAVLGMSAAAGGSVTFVAAAQVLRTLIILASAPFVSAYLTRGGSSHREV